LFYTFLTTVLLMLMCVLNLHSITFAQNMKGPILSDPELTTELVSGGISFPTTMAFLGPDDILILDKNNGTVKRMVNGDLLNEPLLQVNVSNQGERGMLGIAVQKNNGGPTYVFLYYSEPQPSPTNDKNLSHTIQPTANRLYRYELDLNQSRLIKPMPILALPASLKTNHNGGVVTIGPDNNVYTVVGDLVGHRTLAQNQRSAKDVDGSGGILRVTPEGNPLDHGTISNSYPLSLYYAYGIRNSFGIAFDPITGKLWDTENGDSYGDEINLAEPGFNSGWSRVQGMPSLYFSNSHENFNPGDLVDFGGKGKYSDPEFSWNFSVGVTAIKFFDSDKLGEKYKNDMFVGDFHNGYLYHFDLNKKRTGLSLNASLDDKVANKKDELKQVIFGQGFGAITDIEVGPDGYLYVLSLHQGGPNCNPKHPEQALGCIKYTSGIEGSLYRIIRR
jgi:glucose/arabinose dehydrogenase